MVCNRNELTEIYDWCDTNLGKILIKWIPLWRLTISIQTEIVKNKWQNKSYFDVEFRDEFVRFYFLNDTDAILFKLIWG